LVQLAREVQALEQEKFLETTEGTSTSLRRYLNRPNSAFVRLMRTQAHHKAEEYAARWMKCGPGGIRWTALNCSTWFWGFWGIQSEWRSPRRRLQSWSLRLKLLVRHRLDLYIQGVGPPRGGGRATDVVVGGITPAPVDAPRCGSRMVDHVGLRIEVGVGTLADLVLWGLSHKTFVFQVFSCCSIKHYFAYFFFVLFISGSIFTPPFVDPGGPSVSLFWTWLGFWGQRGVGFPVWVFVFISLCPFSF